MDNNSERVALSKGVRFLAQVLVTSLVAMLLLIANGAPNSTAGPPCFGDVRLFSADCNDDGRLDVSDAVCLLGYLFRSGPPPLCLAGQNWDDIYVNEGQVSSVTSGMIMDGQVQQSDLAFTAVGSSSQSQTITGRKTFQSTLHINTPFSSSDDILLRTDFAGAGEVQINGTNGEANVKITRDTANHGLIGICDSDGDLQAFLFIDFNGTSAYVADFKAFRIPNPDPEQPGTEIWYNSVEGPELGAYIRGTAELVDGHAKVSFPKHFRMVASERGLTGKVTPHSKDSLGLAITDKSARGITVRELQGGRGCYKFDYFVMAVRKGHEDYRVIRPADEVRFSRSAKENSRSLHKPRVGDSPVPRVDGGESQDG